MTIARLWLSLVVGQSPEQICMAICKLYKLAIGLSGEKSLFPIYTKSRPWIANIHTHLSESNGRKHMMLMNLPHTAAWPCVYCTYAHINNHHLFKQEQWISHSCHSVKTANTDPLYLLFCTWHKTLHVFVDHRLGSNSSACCYIIVKVGRKTRCKCFKRIDRSKDQKEDLFDSPFFPLWTFSCCKTKKMLCGINRYVTPYKKSKIASPLLTSNILWGKKNVTIKESY